MSVINTNRASSILVDDGKLSRTIVSSLAVNPRDIQVPDLSRVPTDPSFACFLIDKSGSMKPYTQDVIEGQGIMINTLRASAQCLNGALFVVQYLFADRVEVLNPFKPLSSTGSDDIQLLSVSKAYQAGGSTALYKSLFYMLQDMAANIAHAHEGGVEATFTVGVITDGEDTEGEVSPSQICNILQELQEKGFLASSVILGLINPDFTEQMLEELRLRLGFQAAIPLSRNPQEIRRAFLLGSQFAVGSSAAR